MPLLDRTCHKEGGVVWARQERGAEDVDRLTRHPVPLLKCIYDRKRRTGQEMEGEREGETGREEWFEQERGAEDVDCLRRTMASLPYWR